MVPKIVAFLFLLYLKYFRHLRWLLIINVSYFSILFSNRDSTYLKIIKKLPNGSLAVDMNRYVFQTS